MLSAEFDGETTSPLSVGDGDRGEDDGDRREDGDETDGDGDGDRREDGDARGAVEEATGCAGFAG